MKVTIANESCYDSHSCVTEIEPASVFRPAKDNATQFDGHRHDQDRVLEPYDHDRQKEHQRGLYNESFCVDGLFDALTEDTGDRLIHFKRTLEGMTQDLIHKK